MKSSVFKLFAKRFLFVLALALGAAFHVRWANAAGPMEITECKIIDTSGSYVLANNLAGSGICLRVNVDFVTIDLAGFLITGNGSGFGILGTARNLAVRNGTVTGFAVGVVVLDGSIVEGVRAVGNADRGIVATTSAAIMGNIVLGNTSHGIQAGAGSIVRNNTVQGNRGLGIFILPAEDDPEVAGSGSLVSGNGLEVARIVVDECLAPRQN